MSKFSGVIKVLSTDASKVKAAVLKAIAEVDGVVIPAIEKYQPEADALANVIVPGSSKFVDLGATAVEELAGVLDKGGAALKSNLLNAGFDSTALTAIEALIPQFKASVAATTVTSSPAPTPITTK